MDQGNEDGRAGYPLMLVMDRMTSPTLLFKVGKFVKLNYKVHYASSQGAPLTKVHTRGPLTRKIGLAKTLHMFVRCMYVSLSSKPLIRHGSDRPSGYSVLDYTNSIMYLVHTTLTRMHMRSIDRMTSLSPYEARGKLRCAMALTPNTPIAHASWSRAALFASGCSRKVKVGEPSIFWSLGIVILDMNLCREGSRKGGRGCVL